MKNQLFKTTFLLGVLLAASCSKLTKATDFITQPTAREIYARNFTNDSLPYLSWNTAVSKALKDSISIETPYAEVGVFNAETFPVYGYDVVLERGRDYQFTVETDSLNPLVFIDLYTKIADSIPRYELAEQAAYKAGSLNFLSKKSGDYKIIIQPQLGAVSKFSIKISGKPSYNFPVAGVSGKAIQSYWGATRDGGKRSHEGIDIFAGRGTPVLASVDGFVIRTGNRGLGGKQVWLREGLFGNSLYYAHLDSIIATSGQRVKVGDTLGLVGNTGNARTTPPHLHFGVYSRGEGAINPLPFVKEEPVLEASALGNGTAQQYQVTGGSANLRASASAKAKKIGELRKRDTIQILGQTKEWLHIETTQQQRAYLHKSLATPL